VSQHLDYTCAHSYIAAAAGAGDGSALSHGHAILLLLVARITGARHVIAIVARATVRRVMKIVLHASV
jgi:hypothetical protein